MLNAEHPSEGTIKWAAGSPNVLNVAVTRAQRRLYVVGDMARWMKWDLAKIMGKKNLGGQDKGTVRSPSLSIRAQ